MKVVVLGTGATSGTLRTAGGVDGFLKRLADVRPNWEQDYAELARVVGNCEGAPEELGLDRLWTRIDYYSKFKLIFGSEYGGEAAIQLRKAVTDAYSYKNEIEKLTKIKTAFTLKGVLSGLTAGDALISFNWDTLAETILQRMLSIELVQAPHPSASSHIRLIKPHGSLSWIHQSNVPVVFPDGSKPLLESMTSEQIYGGPNFKQPLLLGAVPIKSELLEEIQRSQAGLHEIVANQWREVVDVLSRATIVEVVGYRFPPEDGYGRFILREAIRRRSQGMKLPKVRYYSLQRDRGEYEQAFREVFGSDVNYEYLGEVESVFHIGGTHMHKIKIDNNAFVYPMPMALVGALVNGKPNFMAVGWISRVNFRPPMIGVALGPHYTNKGIEEQKAFSVNIPGMSLIEKTDYCGLVSGSSTDKSTLFDVFYGDLKNAPLIQECPICIACKVHEIVKLPSNTLFIGEIVEVYSEDRYLTDGKPDIKKINPFTLTMPDNNYWEIGKNAGKAWSIGKKQ